VNHLPGVANAGLEAGLEKAEKPPDADLNAEKPPPVGVEVLDADFDSSGIGTERNEVVPKLGFADPRAEVAPKRGIAEPPRVDVLPNVGFADAFEGASPKGEGPLDAEAKVVDPKALTAGVAAICGGLEKAD